MAHALTGSTSASYGRHYANFATWCARQADTPCPLPASTATVLRWLDSDVLAHGRVQPQSLQPYLSAINTIHDDLGFDKPAMGRGVQQYRRGAAHLRSQQGREATRVYLPTPVIERLLLWALSLNLDRANARERSAFRAAVAVILTFSFFARGGTGSQLLSDHVRRSVAGTTITLAHEKGYATAARARTITLPAGAIKGLDDLLIKWESFRGPIVQRACYYALPSDNRRTFPASAIDTWTAEALAHLDVQPPAGDLWSGHSLRKGAASGAAAIDVALHRICHMGGWRDQRGAVLSYIDPTCPSSDAARRFFGWLRAH